MWRLHQLNELWVDQNLPNSSYENLCADFLPQNPFIQFKNGVSAWYDGIFTIVLTSHHNTTTRRCSPELGKPDQIDFHFRLSNPNVEGQYSSPASLQSVSFTPQSHCVSSCPYPKVPQILLSPTTSQLGGDPPKSHTSTLTQLGLEVANFRGESPSLCVQISMVQSRSAQLGTKTLLDSGSLGFCLMMDRKMDGFWHGWNRDFFFSGDFCL